MNGLLPKKVSGRLLNQSAGVPTEFAGELFFENGVSASFYCSFLTHNEQRVVISGTIGNLQVADFVLPFFGNEVSFEVNNAAFQVDGCRFNMEARTRKVSVPEYSDGHVTSQETNMFRNFTNQVCSGQLNSKWPQLALQTQKIMDACLESARQDEKVINLIH